MPWIACQGAARNVQLREPHHILSAGTLVLGADVTQDVAGVSVAAIVASRDELFANYFADLRGQSPFVFSPPIHEHSWKPLLDCCCSMPLKSWTSASLTFLKPRTLRM